MPWIIFRNGVFYGSANSAVGAKVSLQHDYPHLMWADARNSHDGEIAWLAVDYTSGSGDAIVFAIVKREA